MVSCWLSQNAAAAQCALGCRRSPRHAPLVAAAQRPITPAAAPRPATAAATRRTPPPCLGTSASATASSSGTPQMPSLSRAPRPPPVLQDNVVGCSRGLDAQRWPLADYGNMRTMWWTAIGAWMHNAGLLRSADYGHMRYNKVPWILYDSNNPMKAETILLQQVPRTPTQQQCPEQLTHNNNPVC